MNPNQKEVSYKSANTYATLNMLTKKTKHVWFVCHGIGYLSRYFLKYFNELNSDENYIIAPQAPSKYYLGSSYKHVGASWLTKENTATETDNVMAYFDAVLQAEKVSEDHHLIVLGYSQGVSVALRYISRRKLSCNQLVLVAGGIPHELQAKDVAFLNGKTKVSFIYGNQDQYLTATRLEDTKKRFYELFGDEAYIVTFDGKHEMPKKIINQLVR